MNNPWFDAQGTNVFRSLTLIHKSVQRFRLAGARPSLISFYRRLAVEFQIVRFYCIVGPGRRRWTADYYISLETRAAVRKIGAFPNASSALSCGFSCIVSVVCHGTGRRL